SSIGTGLSFTTPAMSGTTTFYAEAENNGCTSTRLSVQAVINPKPAPPVTSDATRCGPGQFTLTASSSETIYWYDHQTGETLLATGSTFTTPFVSTSEEYYVETGNSCRSNRVDVHADIVSMPNAPILFDTSRCSDGVLTIRAVSSEQVNWYNVPSGGT